MEQRKHSMYPLIPLCVAALLADPEGLSPLDKNLRNQYIGIFPRSRQSLCLPHGRSPTLPRTRRNEMSRPSELVIRDVRGLRRSLRGGRGVPQAAGELGPVLR